jgi:PAS domain S-box-containing protein
MNLAADATRAVEAARFKLLADYLPAWIALYDAKSERCLFANRGYAEAFGLTEQDILGKTFAEIIGPEAMRSIQPAVDKVLSERVPVSYERELPEADGTPRWIEVHLIPQLDARTASRWRAACSSTTSPSTAWPSARCASRGSGWTSSCRPRSRASCSTRTASPPT